MRHRIGPSGTTCADPGQNGAQSTVILVEQQIYSARNRIGRRSDKAERDAALGHKRAFSRFEPMSALPPEADMCSAGAHVRFVLIADIDAHTTCAG